MFQQFTNKPDSVPNFGGIPDSVSLLISIPDCVQWISDSFQQFDSTTDSVQKFGIIPDSVSKLVSIPDSVPQFVSIPDSVSQLICIPDSVQVFVSIPDNIPWLVNIPHSVQQFISIADSIQWIHDSVPQFVSVPDSSRPFVSIPYSVQQFVRLQDSVPKFGSIPDSAPQCSPVQDTIHLQRIKLPLKLLEIVHEEHHHIIMALHRKSSRFCENAFAGFVVFACGVSILISMKSHSFSRTSRIFKLQMSREVQENRKIFLAVFGENRNYENIGKEQSQASKKLENKNEITGWFQRKPTEKYISGKFHPILVKPSLISNSVCKNSTVDILIYSLSSWNNFHQRIAMRESWAGTNTFTDIQIKTVFFLGRPPTAADQTQIESENEKYGDIVEGDFLDGRTKISMKSLLALQWINDNCLHAKYIIKADDDMFVNIFYVIEFAVSEIFTENKVIMCHVRPNNTNVIVRNRNSRWYIPDNILPGQKTFPTTCFANMILFTADLVPEMYRASFSVPYCTVDDVYIFGMLVELVKDTHFQSIGATISMDQNEAYQNLVYQTHPQYLASEVKNTEYFRKFWDAALRRVPSWAKGRLAKNYST
ncbi:uncharacterized protein LOC132549866 [Ylistrum balloti]|uniref:uncharacterized protein LOC132549866 n=1 Tax=Ylistrum balloti TaxID=509963 RepID=UPI002905CAEF|nr:uncharacterized protein LOC132549866 [Ylistrum balloti]